MSSKTHILALLIALNINCFYAMDDKLPDFVEEGARPILKDGQAVSICNAMKAFYQDFLTSTFVTLPKNSIAFDFFVHKKGKKYKISRDGRIDLFKLDRFVSCLFEDINEQEILIATITDLVTKYTDGTITRATYSNALNEYELNEESNIAQYLINSQKHINKFKTVKNALETLKKEACTSALTLENAMRCLPTELTAEPIIKGLAEAYIRENFPIV